MKKKFDFVTLLLTFGVSAVVFTLMLMAVYSVSTNWVFRSFGTGAALAVTAAAAYGAMTAGLKLRKNMVVNLPAVFSKSVAVSLVLLFVLGFAGQVLYSIQIETKKVKDGEKEKTEVVKKVNDADLAILLDCSGSMSSFNKDVLLACDEFIDGLPEGARLGGGVFADSVVIEDLTKMDSSGKTKMKEAMRVNLSDEFGNDFIRAYSDVYDMFESQSSEGRYKALFIFTDGDGAHDKETNAQKFKDAGIEIHSIRPVGSYASDTDDLIELVGATGGTDNEISSSTGASRMDNVLNALKQIIEKTEKKTVKTPVYKNKTEIKFSEGMLLYDEETPVRGIAVRVASFLVFALLIQLIYFRKQNMLAAVVTVIQGLCAAFIATGLGVTGLPVLVGVSTALFMFSAFLILSFEEEGS